MKTSRVGTICVRPGRKFQRRMRKVLHYLNDNRALTGRYIEETFNTQKIGAAQRHERFHGTGKGLPWDWRLRAHHEA